MAKFTGRFLAPEWTWWIRIQFRADNCLNAAASIDYNGNSACQYWLRKIKNGPVNSWSGFRVIWFLQHWWALLKLKLNHGNFNATIWVFAPFPRAIRPEIFLRPHLWCEHTLKLVEIDIQKRWKMWQKFCLVPLQTKQIPNACQWDMFCTLF